MRVLGRVEKFRDKLQLDVRTLEPAADVDPRRWRRRCAATPTSWRASSSSSSRRSRNDGLRGVVARVLAETRRCARIPATLDGHHSYAGGLLEHTVGVATLCRETAQLHPRLRRDLLLAAALVHDVGRTRELGRGPVFAPTEEGRCSATSTSGCA